MNDESTNRANKLIAEIASQYPGSDLAQALASPTPMADTQASEPKARPKPQPRPKPEPEPETEKPYKPLRLHDIVYVRVPGSGWDGPII